MRGGAAGQSTAHPCPDLPPEAPPRCAAVLGPKSGREEMICRLMRLKIIECLTKSRKIANNDENILDGIE